MKDKIILNWLINWFINYKKNLIFYNNILGWWNLGWLGEGMKLWVFNLESIFKYLYDNKRIGNFEDDFENLLIFI